MMPGLNERSTSESLIEGLTVDASAVLDERRRDRSLIGRQGAYALHAHHDSRELTKPARDRFLARFEDEVDPQRELGEPERLRRAEYARKAYMLGLARKSAATRARAKNV